MNTPARVVIVGAGPAGVRAAQTLVAAGLRPLVLDENARCGGQIYRQPPADAGFERTARERYGFEARQAGALHAAMAAVLPHIDYRPDTLAWACEAGELHTVGARGAERLPFTHLIVASGATDRVLPVPGWTLPGVYTLGAAQVALKAQGCAIGRRVAFAGSGPLLYLVAYQYARAGARVIAVLDSNSLRQQAAAVPWLLRQPTLLAKGLYYMGWLRAHGVAVMHDAVLRGIEGMHSVETLRWVPRSRLGDGAAVRTLSCDALGLSFGLRPETQLADLAGCQFAFDETSRTWLPLRDTEGRSSVPGVYLAGDGAGIAGADAAERGGRRAALALLADLGMRPLGAPTRAALARAQSRSMAFRYGIERAFAVDPGMASHWPDEMPVCRCEEICAGTLRRCIREDGVGELNRLKAMTRVGMGRCQGRMCAEAAARLLAHESGADLAAVGRLRAQAPLKPIALSALLDGSLAVATQGPHDE